MLYIVAVALVLVVAAGAAIIALARTVRRQKADIHDLEWHLNSAHAEIDLRTELAWADNHEVEALQDQLDQSNAYIERLNGLYLDLQRQIVEAHDPNDPGYDPEVLGLRKELEFERTRSAICDAALSNALEVIDHVNDAYDELCIEHEALKSLLDDVNKAEDDGFEAWVVSSLPQED